jgi:hypothetical protein
LDEPSLLIGGDEVIKYENTLEYSQRQKRKGGKGEAEIKEEGPAPLLPKIPNSALPLLPAIIGPGIRL